MGNQKRWSWCSDTKVECEAHVLHITAVVACTGSVREKKWSSALLLTVNSFFLRGVYCQGYGPAEHCLLATIIASLLYHI
jgi:hypothetical protein